MASADKSRPALLRTSRSGASTQTHRLPPLVKASGWHAADPGVPGHRDERRLRSLARLQKGWMVRAPGPLGTAQARRPEAALAIAMTTIKPTGAALMSAGTDRLFDIGFHQDLYYRFRHDSHVLRLPDRPLWVRRHCRGGGHIGQGGARRGARQAGGDNPGSGWRGGRLRAGKRSFTRRA